MTGEYRSRLVRQMFVNHTRLLGVVVGVIGLIVPVGRCAAAPAIAGLPVNGPGCPYDFLSQMPPGEFCVYRGATRLTVGPVCSADAVVIWSTHGDFPGPGVPRPAAPRRDVYFGFVDAPSLLLHAVASRRTRAHLIEYSMAPDQAPVPIDGLTTLGLSSLGARTLTMTLPVPLALSDDEGACAFDSYRGLFIGVIGLPPASGEARTRE